jgi:hypothetical protein
MEMFTICIVVYMIKIYDYLRYQLKRVCENFRTMLISSDLSLSCPCMYMKL